MAANIGERSPIDSRYVSQDGTEARLTTTLPHYPEKETQRVMERTPLHATEDQGVNPRDRSVPCDLTQSILESA